MTKEKNRQGNTDNILTFTILLLMIGIFTEILKLTTQSEFCGTQLWNILPGGMQVDYIVRHYALLNLNHNLLLPIIIMDVHCH